MRKKIKLFIILGSVGVLFFVSLTLWAFFSLLSFGKDKISSVNLSEQKTQIQTTVSLLSGVNTLNCWSHIQSLANWENILNKPLSISYNNLISACSQKSSLDCNTEECAKSNIKKMNTQQEDVI